MVYHHLKQEREKKEGFNLIPMCLNIYIVLFFIALLFILIPGAQV